MSEHAGKTTVFSCMSFVRMSASVRMRSFRARGLAGIQDLLRNVPRQRNRLQRGVAAILREYVTAEFPGGYTVLRRPDIGNRMKHPPRCARTRASSRSWLRPMPERKYGGSPGCTGSFFFRNPYWSRYRPRMRNSSIQFPIKNSLDKFALAYYIKN